MQRRRQRQIVQRLLGRGRAARVLGLMLLFDVMAVVVVIVIVMVMIGHDAPCARDGPIRPRMGRGVKARCKAV